MGILTRERGRERLTINMDSSKDHENFIYIVKLVEQVEQYNEMADAMKKITNFNVE